MVVWREPHLLCSSWRLATLAPYFFPFNKSFKFISLWQVVRTVFQHPLARWQLALLEKPLTSRPEKAENDDLERPSPSTGRRPRQHEAVCTQSGPTMKCQIGPPWSLSLGFSLVLTKKLALPWSAATVATRRGPVISAFPLQIRNAQRQGY